MANTKIIFTADGNEQFQIERTVQGNYKISQVLSETEAVQVGGLYHSASELLDGLVELAIFSSNEDSVALKDINTAIRSIGHSLKDYLSTNQF
ncbi:hypothetical protein A1D22_09335 [Pasteurellaceae bacterium LFhippo2]|nr:hypothetical protein [Pasteurellaceae bacterium LFhippo2]